MSSTELLAKYGERLNDVKDANDLRSVIYEILLFDEKLAQAEADRLSYRLSEELLRAK